jgi:hypothetical protein
VKPLLPTKGRNRRILLLPLTSRLFGHPNAILPGIAQREGGIDGSMDAKRSILCAGRDGLLLQSRKRVLSRRFQVETALALTELEAVCAGHCFDVIVLCHTLTANERKQASEMVRKKFPRSKILSLKREFETPSGPYVDKEMCVDDGPEALVRTVTAML